MAKTKYLFQKQRSSFTQKIFENGFNVAAYVLFALKEGAKGFLEELPDSYPGFRLMKEMFEVGRYKKGFNKETIRTNLYRLRKQGLVAKDAKEKVYYLTDKGEKFVAYIENRYSILKKPWDGKLRIVIFDIPEAQKHWREVVRKELILLQFQQLQKSVYVGKYPVPESLYEEIEEAGLGRYIFIFTVDKVDRKEEIVRLLESEN